jgi:hypothetical protein
MSAMISQYFRRCQLVSNHPRQPFGSGREYDNQAGNFKDYRRASVGRILAVFSFTQQ